MNASWLEAIEFMDRESCIRLVETLVHFVWQGCVVGLVVLVFGWLLRSASARIRYVFYLTALISMVMCLPITYMLVPSRSVRVAKVSGAIERAAPKIAIPAELDTSQIDTVREARSEIEPTEHVPRRPAANEIVVNEVSEVLPTTEVDPQQPAAPPLLERLAPLATTAYLLGVTMMMLRLAAGMWGGHRLTSCSVAVVERELLGIMAQQARRIGLKAVPAMAYCERVTVPVVIGILKPTILLPSSLASGMAADQLEAIFLHELAHVRRLDLLANLLQRVIESVLFFHPAVWFVSQRVSIERENCCDDFVVHSGCERFHYAAALIRMAEVSGQLRGMDLAPVSTLAATGDSPSRFKRRVMRLLDGEPRVRLTRAGMICAAILVLLLVASPIAVQQYLARAIADDAVSAQANPDQGSGAKGETKESDADGKPRISRTAHQLRRDRKEATDLLARLLEDQEFEKVAAQFNEDLRHTLTADKLNHLWQELTAKHGTLRDVDSEGLRQFGVAQRSLIELQWERVVLQMWLDFDDADQVAGISIDYPAEMRPDDAPPGGYYYGERIHEVSGWNLTLEAKVLDLEGNPTEQCLAQFYHDITPEEAQESDWHDPATNKWWRYFTSQSGTASTTAARLRPGWYRVLVRATNSYRGPLGMSQPIQLDGSIRDVSIPVRLQPGGTVRISPTNATDDTPLTRVSTTLTRQDAEWPPLILHPAKNDDDDDAIVYEHVPPGEYNVAAYQRAARYDALEYETADGLKVQIVANETRDVRAELRGRPLTEDEQNTRAPWIVTGRVTDADGKPIAEAEIWASAGWGSLRSSRIATTDEDGRYQGRFTQTGLFVSSYDDDPLNLVSAQVGVYKEGMYEANLNRDGGMHATFRVPRTDEEMPEYVDTQRLFIRGQPREVNFVLLPAAEVVVQVMDAQDKPLPTTRLTLDGNQLPPASGALAQGTTDADGKFSFPKVPAGYDWWFEVALEKRRYARSSPITLGAQKYELVYKHRVEELTGYDRLELVSATDAAGNEVKDRIVADEPYLRPPVPAATQEQGRDILRKVREVNRYWLARPPDEVKSYGYEFRLQGKQPQSITISDPAAGSIYERRGISYYSAIDYVTANPDNVVFRVVEIGDQRIKLVYALKQPVRISAGNGVAGTWNGYFSMGVKEGTLIIDAKTQAPIEHHAGELVEILSNFVEIRDGHYVPLRIQMNKYDLDWKFAIYEPGLWLYDKGTRGGKTGELVAHVENVLINGQPAAKRPIGTGGPTGDQGAATRATPALDPFAASEERKEPDTGLSLEAEIRGPHGRSAANGTLTLWREVGLDEDPRDGDWKDGKTHRTWRHDAFEVYRLPDRPPIVKNLKPGVYRVQATVEVDWNNEPIGFSDPIRVDASRPNQKVMVWVQGGGTLQVTFVDPHNDQSLEYVHLQIEHKDMRYGPSVRFFGANTEGAERTKNNLPPGAYWLTYGGHAIRPGMLEYETQEAGIKVEIERHQTTKLQIPLRGRQLTDEEVKARCPFVVTGVVQDRDGNPIDGARITAIDQTRELRGETLSDADGHYTLRFGSMMYEVGEQVGDNNRLDLDEFVVSVSKSGLIGTNPHVQWHTARRMVLPGDEEPDVDPNRLLLPQQPARINFILVPEARAKLRLTRVDRQPLEGRRIEFGDGSKTPSAVRDFTPRFTNSEGVLNLPGVAVNQAARLSVMLDEVSGVHSAPLVFSSGGNFDVVAQLGSNATGRQQVVVVSVKNERGDELRDQVVRESVNMEHDNPKLREEGLAVLRKVCEVNRYWLGVPPAEIRRYRYDFEYDDGVLHRIVVDEPSSSSLYERRGITLHTALDAIANDFSNLVVEKVIRQGDRIELQYKLRRRLREAAGFGLAGRHYGGYFGTPVDGGTFIIDATTHTLSEHRTRNVNATYSDYAEIREGHYVPLKVVIELKERDWTPFDWTFRVHEPGLWLFDQGTRVTGDKKYTGQVKNVVINERTDQGAN